MEKNSRGLSDILSTATIAILFLVIILMVVVLAFMRGLHSIDKEEEVQKEVRIF